uniref:Uncharacterized protein n=1 Tax=Plectus sambesii TaxID=2011161 RepID=A0A914UIK0_9BILA
MELAQDVKEKITGHVTDKDIANAAQKVADLKAELANEQHQMKEIQLAAQLAEQSHNLHEYEALKEKEVKVKNQERDFEREIAEAEGDYIRLVNEQMVQKHSHKHKS